MLNNALHASAKKAPIILKSTKTVTTTKTTQHLCLAENGENYEIGLNELQSFLEEAPKKQIEKTKHTPTQRTTTKRRANNSRNGESHKRKKKSRASTIKAKAQHWDESDTDATDDENVRRGLICSNDKENDEIFTSTINTSGQSMNAGTNEFWKENTSPKCQTNSNDINDIMQESLSLPLDANEPCPQSYPMPKTSPRKLSAIFETSAEANESVSTNLPPLTLFKSPVIEKMVSNHYKQIHNTTPPKIPMDDLNTFAPLEKDVVARRTTRLFPSKLIRANLYPVGEIEGNDIASTISASSKRKRRNNIEKSTGLGSNVDVDEIAVLVDVSKPKTRENTKKAAKSQKPVENDEAQRIQNEIVSIEIVSLPADVTKPETRRNAKKSNKSQQLVVDDEIALQSVQNKIANIDQPQDDARKSKARRNIDKSKKTLQLVEDVPVETNLNEFATIAIDSSSAGIPKSKARRNTKKSKISQPLVEDDENAVHSIQNEIATIEIDIPPADVAKSNARRNTKKSTKSQQLVEDDEIAEQSIENKIATIDPPQDDARKSKAKGKNEKATKSQRHVDDIIIASNDLLPNIPPVEEKNPKSCRNTRKRINTNSNSIELNEAIQSNQNIDSEKHVTSPVVSNISKKTVKTQRNHAKKTIKTSSSPTDENATALQNSDQNTKSTKTISKSNRAVASARSSSIQAEKQSKKNSKQVAVNDDNEMETEDRMKKSSSSLRKENIDLKSNALQRTIPDETTSKTAKKNTSKSKRQLNEQSSAKASNESILFEAPERDIENAEADQCNQSNMTTTTTSGNRGRLIIYSPSRDRAAVEFLDENRVIISKSMVAKAIGNPNSGVLKGLSDNGMIIDANERLMYSPREGQDINLKKEVKRGVDILEILARRRQSVFILSQQWDD